MEIKFTKQLKSKIDQIDFSNIQFGKSFADYMFSASYKNGKWEDFKIEPYASFNIFPACGALHYGQAIFEGVKAYRTINNDSVIFRPYENIKRMAKSSERLCMPVFPEDYFINALNQVVSHNKDWVPKFKDGSLYIRPFMFASEEVVGVRAANEYKFIIFCVPVGEYYSKSISVKITQKFSRASENGVGFVKAAGNYASALYPAKLAQEEGYDQLIWTDAKEHKYIEESGTMNVMFVIDGKLITPKTSGTILNGITRKSILEIAKAQGIEVEERRVSVEEIYTNYKKGLLTDAFGTGTAASLIPMRSIAFKEENMILPEINSESVSIKLKTELDNIKSGKSIDKKNWLFKVTNT